MPPWYMGELAKVRVFFSFLPGTWAYLPKCGCSFHASLLHGCTCQMQMFFPCLSATWAYLPSADVLFKDWFISDQCSISIFPWARRFLRLCIKTEY